MSQVLVRQVDTTTIERLKLRARGNNRSLEAELRIVLRDAANESYTSRDVMAEVARVRELFAGRAFTDSADLLREDRER